MILLQMEKLSLRSVGGGDSFCILRGGYTGKTIVFIFGC